MDILQVDFMIAGWKMRISYLYEAIRLWLRDSDYSLRPGTTVPVFEELFFRFGVTEPALDVADIYYKDKQLVLTIKPDGLGAIVTNGRVNILSLKGAYYLVDFAKKFNEPQWKIKKGRENDWVEFNQQELLFLLK